jgi:hypothetical protein
MRARYAVHWLPQGAGTHRVRTEKSRSGFHVPALLLMSEIGIAVGKRFRAAVVDNFRSFALKTLGHSNVEEV